MKTGTALCAAITIDDTGAAPEWLHLLPAGAVRTVDGRGPYKVADVAALMSASIAGGKLTLDENHSTDLAAPKGGPAPARGWITELQGRADGVWGRVDWVDPDAWRQYRGVSPVIAHRADGTITAIRRASLTNTPNLAGLTALHSQESKMDFRAWLIETLGLAADVDDDAIAAALKKKLDGDKGDVPAALQSIATAVGVPANADVATVLLGVQQLKDGASNDKVITALQSELATTTGTLNALVESTTRTAAESFVDGAIAAGRVGVKPMRDEYVSMHMEDPARVAKLIGAMPILKGGATLNGTPPADVKDGLGAEDVAVIALMGIDRAEYVKTLGAEQEAVL